MKINTFLIIILLILIIISLFNDFKNIEGAKSCIRYRKKKYDRWKEENDKNMEKQKKKQDSSSKKEGARQGEVSSAATKS